MRLTGGEPLLRRDVTRLIRLLAAKPGLRDLAITTNGVLLAEQAAALKAAGLHRVTVSLDTLRPERFARAHAPEHARPGAGGHRRGGPGRLHRAPRSTPWSCGASNDDELADLIEFGRRRAGRDPVHRVHGRGRRHPLVDGAGRQPPGDPAHAWPRATGPSSRWREASTAPADRYRLPDGTVFGIIASTTAPFCADCDRSRLTADGLWYLCLYAQQGTDLRGPLRRGASTEDLKALILPTWQVRRDRGAEERLARRGTRAADLDRPAPSGPASRNAHAGRLR